MNVRALLRDAIERLTAAQVPSATTTAEVLLLHVLGRDRAFLYAHPESELSLEQERAYRHLVDARAAGKPTQYLTGEQEFWGLSFRVRPGVFIPRPETEHVVEVALSIVRERLAKPEARIVDVGTGTGCIALALASELPQAEIIGVDIDPGALAVAEENARRLHLAHRVRFQQSDLLAMCLEAEDAKEADEANDPRSLVAGDGLAPSPESQPGRAFGIEGSRFDLIVSNPPYVSEAEAGQLPREVREHEPATALYATEEGLGLTRRLIAQAALLLRPVGPAHRSPEGVGGWLVLELGYNMAARVCSLVGEAWSNIEATDDLRGIPRVLAAQKK